MWLDEYHIDGLRIDSTEYIRTVSGAGSEELPDGWSLLQWINESVAERHPGHITIAEDLQGNAWLTKTVGEGGAGFGAQWDAGFVHPVRAAIEAAADQGRSMLAVAAALSGAEGGAFRRVLYSESHDEVANGKARVPQEIAPDDPRGWFAQKRSTLAAALAFTAPGIPMLFQGQEFLQGDWFQDDVPLAWDQAETFQGIVRLYRDLVWLRTNRGQATWGLTGPHVNVHHVDDHRKIIAMRRWEEAGPGDDVVVVANFAREPAHDVMVGFPAPGPWRVRFNSDSRHYSADFGDYQTNTVEAREEGQDGLPARGMVNVGPYSVVIFSQEAGG